MADRTHERTDDGRYPVLVDRVTSELEERGSRFLGAAAPAPTEDAAKAFIAEIRAEHPDATHNCWAYLVGPPGSTRSLAFSDDGEPHNTAGRPMANVVVHSGLGDLAVVVTRYFGGTKLGRGGLVRAYGAAVQEALRDAATVAKVDWVPLRLVVPYEQAALTVRVVGEVEAEVLDQAYGAEVTVALRVPGHREPELRHRLTEALRGPPRWVES